jgi:hypothetical protein
MTIHKILRTYRFLDKDPVIDELRTLIQDEGLFSRLDLVSELANLAPATLQALFHGQTRRPQNATVMAIATALGYQRSWTKERKLNAEEEVILARAWNKRERKRQLEAREPRKTARRKKRKASK